MSTARRNKTNFHFIKKLFILIIIIVSIFSLSVLIYIKLIKANKVNFPPQITKLLSILNLTNNTQSLISTSSLFNLKSLNFQLSHIKSFKIDSGKEQVIQHSSLKNYSPLFFSIENPNNIPISPVIVLNNQNWSSNQAILKTIIPEKSSFTDEEKAIKIWKYLTNNTTHDHAAIETFPVNSLNNPILLLNQFGYAFCLNAASALANLAELAGLKSRIVHLNKHTVTEIFYNNSWHMLDADMGFYLKNPNGSIASVKNIHTNPSMLDVISESDLKKTYTSKYSLYRAYSENQPRSIQSPEELLPPNTPNEFIFTLNPKEEILFYYDWKSEYFWTKYEKVPENYSNGLLISPTKIELDPFTSLIKEFKLPYPILSSYIYSSNLCKTPISIFFSLDNESWTKVESLCRNNTIALSSLFLKGFNASIINEYYLKFSGLLSTLNLTIFTKFQVAPLSIPKLKEGNNTIKAISKNYPLNLNFAFILK